MTSDVITKSEIITVNHAMVSLSLISVPLYSGDKAFVVRLQWSKQCLVRGQRGLIHAST